MQEVKSTTPPPTADDDDDAAADGRRRRRRRRRRETRVDAQSEKLSLNRRRISFFLPLVGERTGVASPAIDSIASVATAASCRNRRPSLVERALHCIYYDNMNARSVCSADQFYKIVINLGTRLIFSGTKITK